MKLHSNSVRPCALVLYPSLAPSLKLKLQLAEFFREKEWLQSRSNYLKSVMAIISRLLITFNTDSMPLLSDLHNPPPSSWTRSRRRRHRRRRRFMIQTLSFVFALSSLSENKRFSFHMDKERGHEHRTSAKFSGFMTLSPLVCILDQFIVLNSRKLSYYVHLLLG